MIALNPMLTLIYFVVMGIDIVLFFLLVRLVLLWRNISWLTPFDQAGRPLVNSLIPKAEKACNLLCNKKLSDKGKIFINLAMLALIRLCLVSLLRNCV